MSHRRAKKLRKVAKLHGLSWKTHYATALIRRALKAMRFKQNKP